MCLTFKQYLILESFDYSKRSFKSGYQINRFHRTKTLWYEHTTMVNGDEIFVHFQGIDETPDTYEVNFSVNSKVDSKGAQASTDNKLFILKHIQNVVKAFIELYKPKKLYCLASGSDDDIRSKKLGLYRNALKKLGGKQVGGMGYKTSAIFESQWMYHGSTKNDIDEFKPNRDETIIDRAIGTHFAADKSISKKFSEGKPWKKFSDEWGKHFGGTAPKGTIYKTRAPPRSQLKTVYQKIYKHGAVASDQSAIGAEIAHTVFSRPENKKLFIAWAKYARNINDTIAEKLYEYLFKNKAPADVNFFGTAAARQSSSFRSYFNNYDSTLNMEPFDGFRRKIVDIYLRIMKDQNIKGIVYKNTSPEETKGLPKEKDRKKGERGSTKSYVIFDPSELKIERE